MFNSSNSLGINNFPIKDIFWVRVLGKSWWCHMSNINCHLAHITCPMSLVTCHMSHFICHLSLEWHHLSHVTCHMSLATCHLLSHVTCQMSLSTSHLSLVTCHLSSVIYQWSVNSRILACSVVKSFWERTNSLTDSQALVFLEGPSPLKIGKIRFFALKKSFLLKYWFFAKDNQPTIFFLATDIF